MSCEQCHTKDEQIRELQARIFYLETKLSEAQSDYYTVLFYEPSSTDLGTRIDFREDELSHSDRKW